MDTAPPDRTAQPASAARGASGTTSRRRWRRRATYLFGVILIGYAALWGVRLGRDYRPVAARRFLAGGPLVIAHRGASAVEAEHSLPAYRRALTDGADVLELDVRLARDGAIVVSHDGDLERTLGVSRTIADEDLAALRAAVAARHPGVAAASLLPTLDEVLSGFPGVRLNVELKDGARPLADAVVAAIERHGAHDRVLVASFDGGALEQFRRVSGGRVATSASVRDAMRFYVCYLLTVPCRPDYEALQIPVRLRRGWLAFRFDRAGFIAFAHRHGLAVHYWRVDDEAEMRRLFVAGADGIMTDDPARAVRARTLASETR